MEQETPMKAALIASAAIILAGTAAYAQDSGPTYSNSIHQSAGDRDSRGTPKYYHSRRGERGAYRQSRDYRGRMSDDDYMQGRSTTGSGSSFDHSGPFYDNSIHQSAGDRDSRGNPKFNQDR
jgi:hypothetical protein